MRITMKQLVSGAALAMVLPVTAACSGGDAAYCDALKGAESDLKGAQAKLGDTEGMKKVAEAFEKITATAPTDVKADWQTVSTLFEKFATDKPDLQALVGEAQKLQGPMLKIQKHAKDTCKVDLGIES